MIDSINDYLEYLDKILYNIPKSEKVLLENLLNSSYGLINSDNIILDIQYIDYLICYTLDRKYINYDTFLQLGEKLENIIYGLKVIK